MLDKIIEASVRHRWLTLLLTLLAVLGAFSSLQRLTFDAFPDLTNVQVQVLTASPGLGSEEVELLVTLPVERALGGLAGIEQLRSLSRPGISAVTVVFAEGTDAWLARQMVQEQLATADIPDDLPPPELGPKTTGLGEVYQFTLASDSHAPHEVYRIFQRDVVPRLRAVDGVVEVNAWGSGLPQLEARLDPYAIAAHGLQLSEIATALEDATGIASAGAIPEGDDRVDVRAQANPATPEQLAMVEVAPGIRLGQLGDVSLTTSPPVGLGTADGEGEVLFGMVQLLAGADARRVTAEVKRTVADIRESLPEGVRLEPIYERSKLVDSTLDTVSHSLVEGGLLVIFVLLLLLGDLRSGLVVASVIPLAMLGAFTGLAFLGFSGNLMSLGAIDFGLVVDGTIVVVESIVALTLLDGRSLATAIAERTRTVARPVLSAVGILVLVYLPILGMTGTEGKLFRPMAVTVLLALVTALVLSFTYVPAVSTLVVKPRGEHATALHRGLSRVYRPVLETALSHPKLTTATAMTGVLFSLLLGATLGFEFVPRLEEGDLVIQTKRLPSIATETALLESSRVETVVKQFPEVQRIASRTGSPAVATDPMGMEEADILVQLAPRDTWTTADTTEGLTDAIAARLAEEAPGAELTFTQPIEMRFNELLEGITSDVGVEIYGPDHGTLLALGQDVARVLEGVEGAADVVPPTLEGMPGIDIDLDPVRLAAQGLDAAEVQLAVTALRRGIEAGSVVRGEYRDPIVLRLGREDGMAIADLPVVRHDGTAVTLADVAEVTSVSRPSAIARKSASRRVVVQANVRGRDAGTYVNEAKALVADQIALPPGYWVEWSGTVEQLAAASARLLVTVPLVLGLVLLSLYYSVGSWSRALLIFLNVPVAASGGLIALFLRQIPLSMSAAVGFIALFGIAVMNGIVWMARARELEHLPSVDAARRSALDRFRPVLMTASVAGIGFLPMAIATGVGAEVQRPLATVVIGGLLTCTPLTLIVLPTLYGWAMGLKHSD